MEMTANCHSNGESFETKDVPNSVAIFWDIENCAVPNGVQPEDVAGNILQAISMHPVLRGPVTLFSAYGDFNIISRRMREGFQRTGVNLIDVPNGRKDAADKAILVDMFLFALDNAPPSTIFLISGDVDFSPALHKLGQRGFKIVLAIPFRGRVSYALSNAGHFLLDWPSLARGECYVTAKPSLYPVPSFQHSYSNNLLPSGCNVQNKGHDKWNAANGGTESNLPHNTPNPRDSYNLNQEQFVGNETNNMGTYDSYNLNQEQFVGNETNNMGTYSSSLALAAPASVQASQNMLSSMPGSKALILSSEDNKNEKFSVAYPLSGSSVPVVSAQGPSQMILSSMPGRKSPGPFPSSSKSVKTLVAASTRTNVSKKPVLCMQPGDIQDLKTQLENLLRVYEGGLMLSCLHKEYYKAFRRHLDVASDNPEELIKLLSGMKDLVIESRGGDFHLCIRRVPNISQQTNTSHSMSTKGKQGIILQNKHGEKKEINNRVQFVANEYDTDLVDTIRGSEVAGNGSRMRKEDKGNK